MPNFSFRSAQAFDAGLAALAALSAGFVAFAMPEPILSGLVQATPLPDFVPAAQPPLGDTARFAVVGAAALFAFAAVWALMALLDRIPSRRRRQAEPEAEAPRLRRADSHPDAPARRPLLAARDLGEPLELDEPLEAPAEEPPVDETVQRPLPAFLVPQEPDPEPEAEAQPAPETARAAEVEPEPEPLPEPAPQPAPVPLSELAAQLPESEEEEGEADQSLAQLVNRIEFGLARKRQALPAAEPAPGELSAEGEPEADRERVGHRLRSAINDLQKIASSGA